MGGIFIGWHEETTTFTWPLYRNPRSMEGRSTYYPGQPKKNPVYRSTCYHTLPYLSLLTNMPRLRYATPGLLTVILDLTYTKQTPLGQTCIYVYSPSCSLSILSIERELNYSAEIQTRLILDLLYLETYTNQTTKKDVHRKPTVVILPADRARS